MTNTAATKVYQKNYLLKIGISIFVTFLFLGIVLSIFDIGDTSTRSLKFNDVNVYALIILASLVGPVLEEVAFRGSFTKKRWWVFVSYAVAALYIFSVSNYYLIPLLVIFIILNELSKKNEISIYAYIANAMLFSLMHYKFSDLLSISAYPGILTTCGMTFILIWMVLNFGLWASMLFHIINNSIVTAIMILGFEMADKKMQKVENQNFVMTFQPTSLFNSESSISLIPNKEVKTTNTTISAVYTAIDYNAKPEEVYFGNYNITISAKPGSKRKLNVKDFKELLDKADL